MLRQPIIYNDNSYEESQACNEERALRLGKDEKLAKEAGIQFNVKVLTNVLTFIYFVFLEDLGWPAHG